MALRTPRLPGLLALLLAATAAYAAEPSKAANSRSSRPPGRARVIYTIVPGVGLPDCRVGMSLRQGMEKFGKRDLWEGMYVMYDKEGLDLRIVDGRVATVFFYFRAG